MTTGVITDFVTVSRNSTATYWGEGGTLMTAAANQPRLEIDPVTGDRRGILIEESRTNLLRGSNNVVASPWGGNYGPGVSNAALAPDGTMTAARVVRSAGNLLAGGGVTQSNTKSATATRYTFSCFLKRDQFNQGQIFANGASSSSSDSCSVRVDLTNGEVVNFSPGTNSFTEVSTLVSNAGNGWWRVSISFLSDAHTSIVVRIYSFDSTTNVGDGTSGILAWGAQLEEGGFLTSYIPTTTAQVTRASESASIQNTGWFKASTSTIVIDCTTFATLGTLAAERKNSFFFNGPSNNSFESFFASAGTYQILGSGGTLYGSGRIGNAPLQGQKIVFALTYGNDGVAGSVNGAAVAEITSGRPAPESLTSFFIGSRGTTRQINGHIRSFSYIPQRVTNQRLQQLSAA